MWNVLVTEKFVVLCSVFYYFIAYHFSIIRSSLTSHRIMLCSFTKSWGCPKNKKFMTWTLQWIGESELFATFEQVFEHDVQGVKGKKKLPSYCFYKINKNIKKY